MIFSHWIKGALVLIFSLSLKDTLKTRKEIRKGNVQWVAWKGKYDSVYYEKQKNLLNQPTSK